MPISHLLGLLKPAEVVSKIIGISLLFILAMSFEVRGRWETPSYFFAFRYLKPFTRQWPLQLTTNTLTLVSP